jgi:hypothetical protein
MKDMKEYKVSFGFRIETNSTAINKRPRNRKQPPMIPFITIIGAILQPIISTVLQYSFPK